MERDLIYTPDQTDHAAVDMMTNMQELIDEADLSEFEEMEAGHDFNDTDSEEILSINEFLKNQIGNTFGNILEPPNHQQIFVESEHSNADHNGEDLESIDQLETVIPARSNIAAQNVDLISQAENGLTQSVVHQLETVLPNEPNSAIQNSETQEEGNSLRQIVTDQSATILPNESGSAAQKVDLIVQQDKVIPKPKVTKKHQTTSKKSSDNGKQQKFVRNDAQTEATEHTSSSNNNICESSNASIASSSPAQKTDKNEQVASNPIILTVKSKKPTQNGEKSKPTAQHSKVATGALPRQKEASTKNEVTITPIDDKIVSSVSQDYTEVIATEKILPVERSEVASVIQQQVIDSNIEASVRDVSSKTVTSSEARDIQLAGSSKSLPYTSLNEQKIVSSSSSSQFGTPSKQTPTPKPVKNTGKTTKNVAAPSKASKVSNETKKLTHKRQMKHAVPNISVESVTPEQAITTAFTLSHPSDVEQSQTVPINEDPNLIAETRNYDSHQEVLDQTIIDEIVDELNASGAIMEDVHEGTQVDVVREDIIEEVERVHDEQVNDTITEQLETTQDEQVNDELEDLVDSENISDLEDNDDSSLQVETQHEHVSELVSHEEEEVTNAETTESKPLQQNLSDMVHDTKRLIQVSNFSFPLSYLNFHLKKKTISANEG